jgi:hypothetical protein
MLDFLRFGHPWRAIVLGLVRYLWLDQARPRAVNDWLYPPEMRV